MGFAQLRLQCHRLAKRFSPSSTNKWPPETKREWGRKIEMDSDVKARVDAMWGELGL